ncbi:MAG: protein kinase domain-containing protein [Phormidium sp.]
MDTLPLIKDRYQVIRHLGSGGFGETFLAEDTQMPSGRRCVVKRLKPIADNSQIYQLVQERFQREAAILEELGSHHPQIPTLYGYFRDDDHFYLVQEYIEGETLSSYLQHHGLASESTVREILVSLLPVLEYVHSKKIVHRDIKPDNIILRTGSLEPVLLDFGAVKETMGTVVTEGGHSTRSVVVGTPGFMPSEQAGGRPVYSSDLYALGLTAIYALTGKIPDELDSDPMTGIVLWRNYAPGVTPTFASILDRAIHPHAPHRFPIARQMWEALTQQSPSQTPVIMGGHPSQQPVPVPGFPGNSSGYPPATEISQPVASETQISQPPAVAPTPTPTSSGMPEWQKAALTGGVIGLFFIGGLLVLRPSFENGDTDSPTADSGDVGGSAVAGEDTANQSGEPQNSPDVAPEPTPIPTPEAPATAPTPPPTSTPPPTPVPQRQITQEQAVASINSWLSAKSQMFSPPYSREVARNLTTGPLLADLLKHDGPISWLQNNNAYYQYGVQRIDSIERFVDSGNRATIEVLVTEDATLYKDGRADPNNTYFKTSRFKYTLERIGDRVKVFDYQSLD